jgi:hypothetical protein
MRGVAIFVSLLMFMFHFLFVYFPILHIGYANREMASGLISQLES